MYFLLFVLKAFLMSLAVATTAAAIFVSACIVFNNIIYYLKKEHDGSLYILNIIFLFVCFVWLFSFVFFLTS